MLKYIQNLSHLSIHRGCRYVFVFDDTEKVITLIKILIPNNFNYPMQFWENLICMNAIENNNLHSFIIINLKGRVHCFSMQVVMNNCFLLNPKKNLLSSVLSFSTMFPKAQNYPFTC